jgi:hypothetical protein
MSISPQFSKIPIREETKAEEDPQFSKIPIREETKAEEE